LAAQRPLDDFDRDLDPTHPGAIGLAPGRSGACVEAWLSLQTKEFRDGVKVVAIDRRAVRRRGIRRALPQARLFWITVHLVLLANNDVTDVRQRVQHEQQGRRGMKVDPAWAHRRLLLRAGNELGPKAWPGQRPVFDTDDPTNEISAAWGNQGAPAADACSARPNGIAGTETSTRRTRFLAACVDADMPEATRLAATIERWWPEIEGSWSWAKRTLGPRATNRVIKQIKRVACGP